MTKRDYRDKTKACEECGRVMVNIHNCKRFCDQCKGPRLKLQKKEAEARRRAKNKEASLHAQRETPVTPDQAEDQLKYKEWYKKHKKSQKTTPETKVAICGKSVLKTRSGKVLAIPGPTYWDNLYFPTPDSATGSWFEGQGSGQNVKGKS